MSYPSSCNSSCTFHLPDPFIFGSKYSSVHGMMLNTRTAAAPYTVLIPKDGDRYARYTLDKVPERTSGGIKTDANW